MTAARTAIPLCLLIGLSACGAVSEAARPAATPTPVDLPPEQRLVAAIEQEGCVLTRDNLGAVLLRANLTQADLPGLTAALQARGQVEAAGGDSIRILSASCI
ncbi:hypothetical protein [Rubellimicrobium sp. CFH 75288]|uniref:hypothetical protein n=1 Tax=Rubellimicrobium sp. CFH 75288 TaxID=2697034 RepID=UPI001412B8ED|nr:hypothetical protein [Rubellimicrobium sp. CFH 75288]NAZ35812.1 hypothetical protein [Rubellimicrobium sp. CFH 75288]